MKTKETAPLFLLVLTTILLGLHCAAMQAQVVEEWVARYDGPGANTDDARAIAVDHNGNVYIAGWSWGGASLYDYATVKYDANGQQQWLARYNGPVNDWDAANDIAVDSVGNVYVTGFSTGIGGNYDFVTIKYNTEGLQQWLTIYDGPDHGNDWANAIHVDENGYVYVTGESQGVGTSFDYCTIKYTPQGQQLWVARYDGPDHYIDAAKAIALDDIGNVCVTGESWGGLLTGLDYATVKYSPLGRELWVERYDGSGAKVPDQARDVKVDRAGSVYVTGMSFGLGTDGDFATIKYDAAGFMQWAARYNGFGNQEDWALSLAVDAQSNVDVAGYSFGGQTTLDDFTTIQYDSLGNENWVARYVGPDKDQARCLALDAEGNVYVTGHSTDAVSDMDYATIKYDSDGQQQWMMRYDGTGNGGDQANSLVLDNAGNVYITGYSDGFAGSNVNEDYSTIKYSQISPSTLTITLTPLNPPIVIPAQGGSFQYNINVHNASTQPQTFAVWNKIRAGNTYYQVFGPATRTLPGGANPTRTLTQSVAATIPAGINYYISYIGTYPNLIQDSSFFTFTKSALSDGGAWVNETTCTGNFLEEYGVTDEQGVQSNAPTQPQVTDLHLSVNPNPFNPITTIRFDLPKAAKVRLEVFDIGGRMVGQPSVAVAVDGRQGRLPHQQWFTAGTHEITFEGSGLPSGVYIYRFTAGAYQASGKMVLMK